MIRNIKCKLLFIVGKNKENILKCKTYVNRIFNHFDCNSGKNANIQSVFKRQLSQKLSFPFWVFKMQISFVLIG